MIKKTVKFEDFEGNEHTQELYFHIGKKDILGINEEKFHSIINRSEELQTMAPDVERAVEKLKQLEFVDDAEVETSGSEEQALVGKAVRLAGRLLSDVIDLSYGVRTADGLGFRKNDRLLELFKESLAYDQLLDDLLTQPDNLVTFVQQLMPN